MDVQMENLTQQEDNCGLGDKGNAENSIPELQPVCGNGDGNPKAHSSESVHSQDRIEKLDMNPTGLDAEVMFETLSDSNLNEEITLDELETLLQNMEKRADATKTAIRNVLLSHHPLFASSFECAGEIADEISCIRSNLDRIIMELSEENSLSGIRAQFDVNKQRSEDHVNKLGEIVSSLEKLKLIHESFLEFENCLENAKVASAAESVFKIDDLVKSLVDEIDGDNADFECQVIEAIRLQCARNRSSLHTLLNQAFDSAVSFSKDPQKLSICADNQLNGQSLQLSTVLAGMDKLSIVESKCERSLGPAVFHQLLIPILEDPFCDIVTKTRARGVMLQLQPSKSFIDQSINELMYGSPKNGNDRLHKILSSPAWKKKESFEMAFKNILTVLRFIKFHVLTENQMQFISSAVWGKCDGDKLCFLILNLLKETLPGSIDADDDRVALAKTFEAELVAIGLVTHDQMVLTQFMEDIEQHIAQKQRTSLLSKARSIIIGDYLSSIVVQNETEKFSLTKLSVNDENTSLNSLSRYRATTKEIKSNFPKVCDLFTLPTMLVSVCATEIIELLHDTMTEATNCTSTARANMLVGTVRDIITMFLHIVPTVHHSELVSIPKVALVFHNDCIYFRHHCLLLAALYRDRFQAATVGDRVIMVDYIPTFREMEDKFFAELVSKATEKIDNAFDGEDEQSVHLAQALKFCAELSAQYKGFPEEHFVNMREIVMERVIERLNLKSELSTCQIKSYVYKVENENVTYQKVAIQLLNEISLKLVNK